MGDLYISVSRVQANNGLAMTVVAVGQVFIGSLTVIWSLLQELLLSLLLLQSNAILALQPTLSWLIDISLLVLLKLWKECGEASDGCGLALLRRMVTRRHPSKSWAWREKREEVWWKFIGHVADELRMSCQRKNSELIEPQRVRSGGDCLKHRRTVTPGARRGSSLGDVASCSSRRSEFLAQSRARLRLREMRPGTLRGQNINRISSQSRKMGAKALKQLTKSQVYIYTYTIQRFSASRNC